jgi:hypothetical protein
VAIQIAGIPGVTIADGGADGVRDMVIGLSEGSVRPRIEVRKVLVDCRYRWPKYRREETKCIRVGEFRSALLEEISTADPIELIDFAL